MKKRITLFSFILLVGILFSDKAFSDFTRTMINMDEGGWKFIRENVTDAENPLFDDSGWLPVSIPHDWNGGIDGVHKDIFTGPNMYRGIGWYRKHFTVNSTFQGKRFFIRFEAAALVADVWLNGVHIGQHKGGYTAFSFDVTSLIKFDGENILSVKVNSANDPTVAPWMQVPFGVYPTSFDYAVYGGIYRDVWLIVTDFIKINETFISTPGVTSSSANVQVLTDVINYSEKSEAVTLVTEIQDSSGNSVTTLESTKTINPKDTLTFNQLIHPLSNPMLWSPDHPYLYRVISKVMIKGENLDEVENPLGFRWYTLQNNGPFILNGENILLKGTNRHQDREGFGYALSNEQHWEDVRIIKKMGHNFLRHAHYPCDEAVLQACDRLGIMVWLEIPVTCCISTDPGFLENAKSQLTEMIREHYNHPCVIVWGLGNESDQSTEASEAYTNTFFRALNTLAHSLDSTRPTTVCNLKYASNQQIVDIYAPQDWNGWYSGVYTSYNPKQLIGEYGADMTLWDHDKYNSTKKWSQEYGCILHEYKASVGRAKASSFPGHCTWIAFDFASPRQDRNTNPIPYMNMKGLYLHDHKTPKDVAYFYQSYYTSSRDNPMVYIVSETWLDRWQKPDSSTIWVYSNCDQVELFNDIGRLSYGFRNRDAGPRKDTRFQWDNVYVKYNTLYAEGIIDGKVVARDTLILNNLPSPTTSVGKTNEENIQNFALSQNYPNPFNPITTIQYQLASLFEVSIRIFNADGQLVRSLVNEKQGSGSHTVIWNGMTDTGQPAATGMYTYQLKAGNSVKTCKMMLVR